MKVPAFDRWLRGGAVELGVRWLGGRRIPGGLAPQPRRDEVGMVADERVLQKERVRKLAGRLGVALGARALWALIERLLVHYGI